MFFIDKYFVSDFFMSYKYDSLDQDNEEIVFVTHSLAKDQLNEWVKEISNQSNQTVKWKYLTGKFVIKTIGNVEEVKKSILSLLHKHDEYYFCNNGKSKYSELSLKMIHAENR